MTLSDDNSREALSPEQWTELRDGYIWLLQNNGLSATLYGDGRLMLTTPTDSDELVEKRHALAALCLYGQPFGFSAEDVAAIELACGAIQDAQVSNEDRQAIERLHSLAARIQSLLPPDSATEKVGSGERNRTP